jgi:hypothetical protein
MSTSRRTPKGLRRYPAARYDLELDGEAFDALMAELAAIARQANDAVDIEDLRNGVGQAIQWYLAGWFTADYVSKITLEEIAEPLARVIEILERQENVHPVVLELGRETELGYADIKGGAERRGALIDDLKRIAAIERRENGRGRPERKDLHQLVHQLANEWLCLTGADFTRHWNGKEPKSLGAQFVHAVVTFIDPDPVTLGAVPKMMERVARERKEGVVMPALNWPKATSAK